MEEGEGQIHRNIELLLDICSKTSRMRSYICSACTEHPDVNDVNEIFKKSTTPSKIGGHLPTMILYIQIAFSMHYGMTSSQSISARAMIKNSFFTVCCFVLFYCLISYPSYTSDSRTFSEKCICVFEVYNGQRPLFER